MGRLCVGQPKGAVPVGTGRQPQSVASAPLSVPIGFPPEHCTPSSLHDLPRTAALVEMPCTAALGLYELGPSAASAPTIYWRVVLPYPPPHPFTAQLGSHFDNRTVGLACRIATPPDADSSGV